MPAWVWIASRRLIYWRKKLARHGDPLDSNTHLTGFPGGSDGNESARNAGNPGLIPGSGRSAGEGNGYPLQYSCLENSMDRGAYQAKVHGITKSWT